jgi:hypothetical protein
MKTLLRTLLATAASLASLFVLAACLDSTNPVTAPADPTRSTSGDTVKAPSGGATTNTCAPCKDGNGTIGSTGYICC